MSTKKEGAIFDIFMRTQSFIPAPFIGATLAYCIFLYYLSSQSSFPFESPFAAFDKIVHMCLFGGLSAMVAMGLHRAKHAYSAAALVLIPVAFSTLYGLTDEAHQLFVASRMFAVGDLAANALGSTIAALLVLHVGRHRKAAGGSGDNHRR